MNYVAAKDSNPNQYILGWSCITLIQTSRETYQHLVILCRVTALIVLLCSRVTVEQFQFAEIAISLILPIYVASKDFPELIVRLDKISTSTTGWENGSVLYWVLNEFKSGGHKEKVFIRLLIAHKNINFLIFYDKGRLYLNNKKRMVKQKHKESAFNI